ncbi:MAG: SLEI family protein [Candidatus Magasanikbacteria bacterium]|nr:SLEI family protein [Candidatus Magasanikbacteria bacterium]
MSFHSSRTLNTATKVVLLAAVFLMPLFVLPFTSEVYEFNKQFLLYGLTLIAFLLWLVRGIFMRQFTIRRTLLDIPILVLLGALLLSSVLSVDRRLSFFGDFAYLDRGFLTFAFLFLFYFLVVQTFESLKGAMTLVVTFLLSGLAASIFFLLKALDLVSFNFLNLPGLNTVSSSHTIFAVFVASVFLLSLSILLVKKTAVLVDVIGVLALLASAATLVLTGFPLVWILTAIGLFFVLVVAMSQMEASRIPVISLVFALFVVSVLFIFLGEPDILKTRLPIEISLSSQTSWDIAWGAFSQNARHFFFGSGPSTFLYDFSQFRPQSFNMNALAWSLRFREPYSLFFAVMAEWGILGILSFFFVVLMGLGIIFAAWMRRHSRQMHAVREELGDKIYLAYLLPFGVAPVWLLVLIAMFLMNLGSVLFLTFWIFLAIFLVSSRGYVQVISEKIYSLKTSPQYVLASSFAVILVFTAAIVLGVYLGRFYGAEVVYAKAQRISAGPASVDERIAMLQRAITLNETRIDYHLLLSDAYLLKARFVSEKPGADAQTIASYVGAAVNQAQRATEISPQNVNTWELLANNYVNASGLANTTDFALKAFQRAAELEPTNPTLQLNIGRLYFSVRRLEDAKAGFESAITLKPDFLIAYQSLAILNEANGDLPGALVAMERGIQYAMRSPEYLFQIGRLYFNRGKGNDLAAAELAFRTALQIEPRYADALYALGVLAERVGKKTEAVQFYKAVQELDPANKDILKKLQGLLSGPPPALPSAK